MACPTVPRDESAIGRDMQPKDASEMCASLETGVADCADVMPDNYPKKRGEIVT